MKKFIAMILVMIMFVVSASGCGKKKAVEVEPESSSVPPSSSEVKPPQKPTTAQAAAHNAVIKPGDVNIIQFDDPEPGDEIAVLTTNEGEIKIRLFKNQSPKTVETFVTLAKDGYYNGQQFDTVVEGYKIEGGGKHNDDKFPEDKEFSLDLWNFRGAMSLANNGTDFMIVQANQCLNPKPELEELKFPQAVIDKYDDVGGAPHQDWENTVFGQVFSGMDVVDKIAAMKLADDGKPAEPVIISTIVIETA